MDIITCTESIRLLTLNFLQKMKRKLIKTCFSLRTYRAYDDKFDFHITKVRLRR
jgi:hypothetical protein